MAALTYSSLQTELQAIVARTPYPYAATDGAFSTLYPGAIQYAENRIYNELPFLAQRQQDTSLTTTANTRSISLHGTTLPILVPERVALLTPSGSTLANGTQVPFLPTSLDFIDMYWPQQSLTWAPGSATACYWCIQGGVNGTDFISPTLVIAPTPDASYTLVLTGLFQQTPLSAGNPQTYLSTVYPSLLLAGCMVFISGALLRNYSSQGVPGLPPDEPGMPVSWEAQFKTLLDAARSEELRRRQQGTDWIDRPPTPAPAPRAPAAPG